MKFDIDVIQLFNEFSNDVAVDIDKDVVVDDKPVESVLNDAVGMFKIDIEFNDDDDVAFEFEIDVL